MREEKRTRTAGPASGMEQAPALTDRAIRAWRGIRAKVIRAVQGAVEELLFFLDPGAKSPGEEERRQQQAAARALEACLGRDPARTLMDLPPEERAQAAAEVHAALAEALGLTPCTVCTEPLRCHGNFLAGEQMIVLNSLVLEEQPMTETDAELLLLTLCHETYHAFQLAACSRPGKYGVSKSEARIWRINFRDYITPEENPERYWIQPLEATARLFATRIVQALREGEAQP